MIWRRLMFRTTVIAITGSAGKSTTTALLGEILSQQYSTNWIPGARNNHSNLVETLLRTRWRHRYTVLELGTREPGTLRRLAWLVAPDIVIVTCVLHFHSNRFPTIEDVAAEKLALPASVGSGGAAILNLDDARVSAMAKLCRGQIRTFGKSQEAFLRVASVQSIWPERLSLIANHGQESVSIQTQLIGEHMAAPVAAALAAAIHCGVPLREAAQVVALTEPVNGRLRPMKIPSGAVVWRDDHCSSLPTLEVALQALSVAKASRKIAIVGDVIDSQMSHKTRKRFVARIVAEVADFGIFMGKDFGPLAQREAAKFGMPPERSQALSGWPELAEWLRSQSRPGDVILLHCWMKHHLERAVLAQFGEIGCYLPDCEIVARCEDCEKLGLVQIQAS